MSPMLEEFYIKFAAWLDEGMPEASEFSCTQGLCTNLYLWSGCDDDLQYELALQFREAGLCEYYPFNGGSHNLYEQEHRNGLMYSNPNRLKWVKNQVEALK